MLNPLRRAVHWMGRHAFPTAIAAIIAIGAAGGGIGYAVASQHSSAAPPSAANPAPTSAATPKARTPGSRGTKMLQRALALLAAQTGQSVSSVQSQLQAGKSVDDIAGAKAPAIESAILAQVNKLAARALSAGKITAAEEATALAAAKTRVEALMAEPGTQLLSDAQKFLQLLPTTGHRAAGAAPSPTAAA